MTLPSPSNLEKGEEQDPVSVALWISQAYFLYLSLSFIF